MSDHANTPDLTKPSGEDPHLSRQLSNRHIQLIAIGGAIGTGLFMGSGKTISLAGPSVIFVYMIIGFMLFFVMRAMGELLLSNMAYKSFSDFAADLLGPWAGFFTGWTYWFCWIVTGIADVIAISGYFKYWWPGLAAWIPALLTIAALLLLNLPTVRAFGETEFWFALIKIIAIVSLIVVGIVMVVSGFTAPNGATSGIDNLWNDGGMFPTGFMGFVAGFQIAVFAFVGIELVGTTAAEAKDPEKNLPKAINSIPIRVLLFYVVALTVIIAVTPWREISADKSPFVAMFTLAGLGIAASVINFVVLTSAASSANSGIYSTSRMVFGLAQEGDAPRALGKLNSRKSPRTPDVLVHLPAGVVDPAVLGRFRDRGLHRRHDHFGAAVHVRVDDHPGELHGVPEASSAPARGVEVQDARRHRDVLGRARVLRLHPLGTDNQGRHPAGTSRHADLVRGSGHRVGDHPASTRSPGTIRRIQVRTGRQPTERREIVLVKIG